MSPQLTSEFQAYLPFIISLTKTKLEEKKKLGGFPRSVSIEQGPEPTAPEDRAFIGQDKSIVLRFPRKSGGTYDVLIIFAQSEVRDLSSPTLSKRLDELLHRYGLSRIGIWITQAPDLHALYDFRKKENFDVIFEDMTPPPDTTQVVLHHHQLVAGLSHETSFSLNLISQQLTKRIHKIAHQVLSDLSAPTYAGDYGHHRCATNAFMRFEEQILSRVLSNLSLGEHSVAADVGCGAGRHSFILAEHIGHIYAYDFSRLMTLIAKDLRSTSAKYERATFKREIHFLIGDIEYDEVLVDEDRLKNNCDLVLASFGMGSFVEDTAKLVRRLRQWLRPGLGRLFISVYNRDSILMSMKPNWKEPSLASELKADAESLTVTLDGGDTIDIFCRPFDYENGEFKKIVESCGCEVETQYTFPTTMALLPNSFLANEGSAVYKFFEAMDMSVASHAERTILTGQHGVSGHYSIYVIKALLE